MIKKKVLSIVLLSSMLLMFSSNLVGCAKSEGTNEIDTEQTNTLVEDSGVETDILGESEDVAIGDSVEMLFDCNVDGSIKTIFDTVFSVDSIYFDVEIEKGYYVSAMPNDVFYEESAKAYEMYIENNADTQSLYDITLKSEICNYWSNLQNYIIANQSYITEVSEVEKDFLLNEYYMIYEVNTYYTEKEFGEAYMQLLANTGVDVTDIDIANAREFIEGFFELLKVELDKYKDSLGVTDAEIVVYQDEQIQELEQYYALVLPALDAVKQGDATALKEALSEEVIKEMSADDEMTWAYLIATLCSDKETAKESLIDTFYSIFEGSIFYKVYTDYTITEFGANEDIEVLISEVISQYVEDNWEGAVDIYVNDFGGVAEDLEVVSNVEEDEDSVASEDVAES